MEAFFVSMCAGKENFNIARILIGVFHGFLVGFQKSFGRFVRRMFRYRNLKLACLSRTLEKLCFQHYMEKSSNLCGVIVEKRG